MQFPRSAVLVKKRESQPKEKIPFRKKVPARKTRWPGGGKHRYQGQASCPLKRKSKLEKSEKGESLCGRGGLIFSSAILAKWGKAHTYPAKGKEKHFRNHSDRGSF